MARISQDHTGIKACMDTPDGELAAYIPTASIAAILLGPGVSITHASVATFARHGTTLVFVGTQGVRCYSSISGASNTELLVLAARTASDDTLRLQAARRLYEIRFDTKLPDHVTLQQMRGMEGARMRATYQSLARQHQIRFRRSYTTGDFDTADPVNQALSSANTCLYGIVAAALASLGIPPGLGLVHTGHRESLVYDIADLYKAEITIPLAFATAKASDPPTAVRHKFRNRLTLTKLLPRIVRDIQHVFGLGAAAAKNDPRDTRLVELWDGAGVVPGGTNYGDQAMKGESVLPVDPSGVVEW